MTHTGWTYTSGHGAKISLNALGNSSQARTPAAYMSFANDAVHMIWRGSENGHAILAKFSPEDNISTREYMLINQCMLYLLVSSMQGAGTTLNPIEYIRQNHLERHFVFTQAQE